MILIKSDREIDLMRQSGHILAGVMKKLEKAVRPGIRTEEIEGLARKLIKESGGKCSFLGYKGYPACLCTSINEEIVHALPSQRRLKEGDILSLDLGVLWKGFHSDMAVTVPVGNVEPEVIRLIRVTKKALKRGIKNVKEGKRFGDVGNAIQRYVESQGFNVVRDLCGHGIGKELHEDPLIFNYGKRGTGPQIKKGMVFCIEPMVSMGSSEIKKSDDNFSFKTKDNSLSAHFEHMIAVTKRGPEILTIPACA